MTFPSEWQILGRDVKYYTTNHPNDFQIYNFLKPLLTMYVEIGTIII